VEVCSQGRFRVHVVVRIGRASMTISTAAVEDRHHMLGKEIETLVITIIIQAITPPTLCFHLGAICIAPFSKDSNTYTQGYIFCLNYSPRQALSVKGSRL
jgi:hypothetical protein